ncbi:hypothetical protein NQ317_019484 [Molorchus minor]|uniref:FAD dependent oxidoreductase domain-containing protein n=1 Tax=Molorchus minor TaxID=1323400 RepID=A0ABQ9JMX6_9CUCU|nr:hypothetical protein NQ317_019484 [Molorchus minor]
MIDFVMGVLLRVVSPLQTPQTSYKAKFFLVAFQYPIFESKGPERQTSCKCSELIPAIKTAKVIKHQVGLRPSRDRVRLEIEIKQGDKNGVQIVHNYGHGGAGITLCVGCAIEAAELVEQVLIQGNLRANCERLLLFHAGGYFGNYFMRFLFI